MSYKTSTTDTNQYFPTPDKLIKKMLEPYYLKSDDARENDDYDCYRVLSSKNILEPSAGEGAIINYIDKKRAFGGWVKFSCCEIDPVLREGLDKLHLSQCPIEIVGHDFLEYKKDVIFNYIFMNPPFNTGAKHFLHAFNISQGAEIVCILNAETLKNAYSIDRKLILKIIEDNQGTIEYIQNAFTDADRPSDVEIALIRVQDKSFNPFDFNINFHTTEDKKESINFKDPNEIMTANVFKNNEIAFDNAKEALKELLAARKKLEYYTDMLFNTATSTHTEHLDKFDKSNTEYGAREVLKSALGDNCISNYQGIYSNTVTKMRVSAWKKITDIPKINNLLSETSRNHLKQTISEQQLLPYTEQNMRNIYLAILLKIPDIRKQTIYDSFDWLTAYHKDNKIFPVGWKTNDSWKVNNKCILARGYGWGGGNNYDTVTFENHNKFVDLERACEYLSGEKCPEWQSMTRFNRYLIISHHEKKNGVKYRYSGRTPIEDLDEKWEQWILSG